MNFEIYFEGENRYSNGLKKEFVTGYYKNNQEYEYSIKNDNNLPTYQTNLHLIFNPEGKQILKDSAGRISLDGEYLDGYFKFNSKNEYYDLDDMKWLNHSKEFNLKQIVTPNNFGSLKDLSYESWLPVAGYFKDGYQDSIWKFKLRYGKNKTTVKYKNGKLNGTREHKLSTFEANTIKYSNDEYYNYKEVAYSQLVKNCKETKTYKNDTLIQSITRYKNGLIYSFNNYENSSISTYKLTPTGDTIDVSNKIGDTLHTRYYNQSGLTRHNKVCKNYCLIQKFEDGIITEKRTYLNNEYVGVSTFRNLHLNTIRKDNYDQRIINPDPNPFRRSSFVNSTPIKSNSIPKTKFYKDDLLEYEGYCNYYSYQESSNFFLINTVYFDTEKPKFKFFVDTSETNTNWLKEYYYNGNLKAEASKFHPTSSINCDEEPELKFDYIPYNFWTRDGKQTVTDGTGYIFYKNEGTPVFEGQLQDSIKVGTWKYYDGNGNLNEFGKYVDGEKDGVWYSGDLKHIHFLEECLDANNPDYEKTKSRLENEISIYNLQRWSSSTEIIFRKLILIVTNLSLGRLTHKTKEMNRKEYNKCVDAHADGLYRFMLKNIGRTDDAQDIVQDVFLKLWEKVDTVDFEKAKSYLFTAAFRTMLDRIKKKKPVSTETVLHSWSRTTAVNTAM